MILDGSQFNKNPSILIIPNKFQIIGKLLFTSAASEF